eukprot:5533374-Heterocapsa_arctica.AAC.1
MPHEDRDFAIDDAFPDDTRAGELKGDVAPDVGAVRDVDNAFVPGSIARCALSGREENVDNLLRSADAICTELSCNCPREGPIVDAEVVENLNDAESANPGVHDDYADVLHVPRLHPCHSLGDHGDDPDGCMVAGAGAGDV